MNTELKLKFDMPLDRFVFDITLNSAYVLNFILDFELLLRVYSDVNQDKNIDLTKCYHNNSTRAEFKLEGLAPHEVVNLIRQQYCNMFDSLNLNLKLER